MAILEITGEKKDSGVEKREFDWSGWNAGMRHLATDLSAIVLPTGNQNMRAHLESVYGC